MSGFTEILENVDKLPISHQVRLLDIIAARIKENKKKAFTDETITSQEEYLQGGYKSGSSNDLFSELGI